MSVLTVEVKKGKQTKISIVPYVQETAPPDDIGLWKYGEVVMPGAKQVDQIACVEAANGAKRYITGLNELAPEVLRLPEKERKAKVREIRKDIIHLEAILASNAIPDDEKTLNLPTAEFMDKVQLVKPSSSEFWEARALFLQLSNTSVYLDMENPYDYIKLRAIEAGGYNLVAPSYSDAKKSGRYKWHLDRFEQTVADKVTLTKLKNRAISELEKLSDNDPEKLRYVLKTILIDCLGYKNSTPTNVLYADADAYINGRSEEKVMKKAAQEFLDTAAKKVEDLKLISIVKDAAAMNYLITKGDGKIYHAKFNTMCGANTTEVVEYLKNPLNEKVLDDLQKTIESEWSK